MSGKKRQGTGEAAEEILEWAHRVGIAQKRVAVWKAPTPLKILQSLEGGRAICQKTSKSGADYYGVLKGGQAFFAECKSCSRANFPLGNIEPHQVEFLRSAHAMGASCWVVVLWTPDTIQAKEALRKLTPNGTAIVALPWPVVDGILLAEKPTVSWQVMVEHARPDMGFYA